LRSLTNPTANDATEQTALDYTINREPGSYTIALDPPNDDVELVSDDQNSKKLWLRSKAAPGWAGKQPFSLSFKATSGGVFDTSAGNLSISHSRIYAERTGLVPYFDSITQSLKLTLNSDYSAELDQDGNFTQSQKVSGKAQYSAQTDNKIVAANVGLVLQGKVDNMPQSQNTSVTWGTQYDVNLTITAIDTDIVDVSGAAGFSGMFGAGTTWEDLSPNPYETSEKCCLSCGF